MILRHARSVVPPHDMVPVVVREPLQEPSRAEADGGRVGARAPDAALAGPDGQPDQHQVEPVVDVHAATWKPTRTSQNGRCESGCRSDVRQRAARRDSLQAVCLEHQRRHLVPEDHLVRPALVLRCGRAAGGKDREVVRYRRGRWCRARARGGQPSELLRTCGAVEYEEACDHGDEA